jgi:beta-lactamase superfamily II metal-dependent hydrolase
MNHEMKMKAFSLMLLAWLLMPAWVRAAAPNVGEPLSAWREGELDIHHINTGLGESSFFILPDGTTLLVDACASDDKMPWRAEPRPDGSRTGGEWIARYIDRATAGRPKKVLNYAMLSHFHQDHMGAVSKGTAGSRVGPYQASGITEVADFLPMEKLIDRKWPDYEGPGGPWNDQKMANYRVFLQWQIKNKGLAVECARPGAGNQIVLRNAPEKFPGFALRILAAGGVIWTGKGNETRNLFPGGAEAKLTENKCSIAFQLTYGKFNYYSGGDLDCVHVDTEPDTMPDIETAVAQACGAVDAMKANHHANFDANGVGFLRVMSPRVVVIDTWAASQPSMNVWRRLRDKTVWPGEREVFATNVMPAAALAIHDEPAQVHGHIVIRVSPGGAEYSVYRIEDTDESGRVKSASGPYKAK